MTRRFTKKELKKSYSINDIVNYDSRVFVVLKDFDYYESNFDFSILDLNENDELTEQDKKFLYEDMREQLFKYIREDVKGNLSLSDDEIFISDMDDLNLNAVSSFYDEEYADKTLKLLRPYIYDAYVKLYNFEFGTDYKNIYNKEATSANDTDKYVPYANTEEMLKDYAEREDISFSLEDYPYNFPFIRIKNKVTGDKFLIIGFSKETVYIANGVVSLDDLCENYTFSDEKPCGKK